MKHIFLIFILCCTRLNVDAQENSQISSKDYEIGKPCPNYQLNEILYFYKKQAKISDFLGKPLILDLFSSGCSSCFKSFPKVNLLQKTYKDRVQILLVGHIDRLIKDRYEKFRALYNLELPVSYDSTSMNATTVGWPHLIWVNEKGIIKAITSSKDLTKENMESFIAGKEFKYGDHSFLAISKAQNETKKLMSLQSDDSTLLYKTELKAYRGEYELAQIRVLGDETHLAAYDSVHFGKNKFYKQLSGIGGIERLYSYAYLGKSFSDFATSPNLYEEYWPKLIMEVIDTTNIKPNYSTFKNVYILKIQVPNMISKNAFLGLMREDLKRYFKYDIRIEKRKMPCYRLIFRDVKKAKTNGGTPFLWIDNYMQRTLITGFKLRNAPIDDLVHALRTSFQGKNGSPIINSTNINYNIDISLTDISMIDFEEVKKALNKNGFDLVKGEIEMKTLIITDPALSQESSGQILHKN
jgi:thiol-disulfide isomerase/thioredoxin